jgi:hypothetical protein
MVRSPVAQAFPRSKGAKDYARLAQILLAEKAPDEGQPQA